MKYLENKKEIYDIAVALLYTDIIPDEQVGWIVVHHPFTQNAVTMINNEFIELTNKENANKWRDFLKNLIKNEDFFKLSRYICNPYKLTFLKYCLPYLDDEDVSRYIAENWILVEYPSRDIFSMEELVNLFKKCKKEILMDEEELETFNNLPDEVVIYRGVSNSDNNEPHALSWTLNKNIAKKFCQRGIQSNPIVLEKKISKDKILCYFAGEQEVIVDTF